MIIRETSREAYKKIKENGLLSLRRFQVYEALCRVEPATGGEVFQEMKRLYGMTIPTNSNTTTRLGELRERGVAAEDGERDCSVSGYKAHIWVVTGKLPAEPPKEAREKCHHCDGRGYTLDQGE